MKTAIVRAWVLLLRSTTYRLSKEFASKNYSPYVCEFIAKGA